ncbi:glutamate uptake regulatory protein [Bordetella ansorpii]|uniref:Glutamate uptake regulatory protein n=1 Tax=Bordetella ansorpii TaxID=288768 RepID=A0A157S693_9BORD|nr:glutamate uptake regulatory protein [Bordetella ansorpii]
MRQGRRRHSAGAFRALPIKERTVDQTDLKILRLLQKDATCSVADIAEQVNLSVTPCWRRIQKLKDDGVIARHTVLLDPKSLGLNLTVFVTIKTSQHNAKWTQSLVGAVTSLPNVVEFHRMAGDIDYLLKVVVEDMAAYDRFYRRLIETVDLLDVSASFSMEVIKSTTELPLNIA